MFAWVEIYRYLAVGAGTLLQGEIALVLSGFLAQQGHLKLLYVFAAGVLAAHLGDITCYWVGRKYGRALLSRFPRLRKGEPRVRAFICRYGAPSVLLARFLLSVKTAAFLTCGAAGMSWARFSIFDIIGCAIWVGVGVGAGYFLGHEAERLVGEIRRYQIIGATAAAVAVGICWAAWCWLRRERVENAG